MTHLIVEHTYPSPLTDAEHDRVAKRLDPCLEQHGARWLRSYLSQDRLRMVCEFEAADAEAVRSSHRSAGVSFDRVWATDVYTLT